MRLSEIQTFSMPMERGGTYYVHFPPEDYLILIAGANIGTAAERFDHPNVLARIPQVFNLKHYHPYRGKWWTVQGGIDFLFAVPKSRTGMVEEVGYSYPKVQIGSDNYSLNVSGGTFPKNCWTDTVRQGAHVGIKCSVRTLRNLAKHAMSPEECKIKGIVFDLSESNRPDRFKELMSEIRTRKELKAGFWIMLKNGCSYSGERGPFYMKGKAQRRREVICQTERGSTFRVPHKYIDWKETAEWNNVKLSIPEAFNRVGSLKRGKK